MLKIVPPENDSYMPAFTNFADWQLHASFYKIDSYMPAFTNFFRPTVTCQLLQICADRQLHARSYKCVQTDSYMSGFQWDLVDSFDRPVQKTSKAIASGHS